MGRTEGETYCINGDMRENEELRERSRTGRSRDSEVLKNGATQRMTVKVADLQ